MYNMNNISNGVDTYTTNVAQSVDPTS